jgi:hypothetical protein
MLKTSQFFLRNPQLRLLNQTQARSFASPHHEEQNFSNHKGGYYNVFGTVLMVREKYAALVHRFGKYNKICEPGLNFKIPFIDKVEYVHDLREQVIDIHT